MGPWVLQVGEKLGDVATPKMAEAMAAVLEDTDWADAAAYEQQQLMLSLSANVQRLVFQSIPLSGSKTFFSWPLALQLVRLKLSQHVRNQGIDLYDQQLPECLWPQTSYQVC